MYYLHDKNAETSDRVVFTHTENIPTEDPEKALKWMAWTAIHAEELKRESGSRMTGRPCTKPVFTFSLAWHPEQRPEKWQMIAAGRQALFALDLQDHEALMVAHDDTEHAHLHVLANLIHPDTGRAKRLSFSRLKLSEWAQEYEEAHGKIYCEQRVENNELREEGKFVKYQEPKLDLKAKITEIYFQCDNGKAFRSALAEHGLKLAQGKRIVILDQDGKIHSLYGQIDGAKAKDIKAKLGDLQLSDVETLREQDKSDAIAPQCEKRPSEAAAEKDPDFYFDRDRQDRDWQESVIDTAIEDRPPKQVSPLKDALKQGTAQPRASVGETPAVESQPKKLLFPKATPSRPGPAHRSPSPFHLNQLQDRQLGELGNFYTEKQSARQALASRLGQQYGEHEAQLRDEVQRLQDLLANSGWMKKLWLKCTGQIPSDPQVELERMGSTLRNIEWRRSEAEQALEKRIKAQQFAIEGRHKQERAGMQLTVPAPEAYAAPTAQELEPDEDMGPEPSFD